MLNAPVSRRRALHAIALCGAAYLYVFPYQARINNPNENVRLYLTAALAEQGTYLIDDYRARWGWVNDCAVRDGHFYSVKAPATSFFGVPIYWAYLRVVEATSLEFDRTVALWLLRVFASILPWLLFLWFFHRWLGRQTSSPLVRDAVFLSVALGSCLYGYGMLFMSHTLSAAAAFGAFMLLHDAKHAGRIRAPRAFLAGLLAAMVTLLEYPGFVASVALAVYALRAIRPFSRMVPFALGGVLPAAAMMHFQWRCFGSPFSPGHLYVENDFLRGRHEEGFFGAVGIQWDALYGLLIHPGAGLFPLTPILLFGIAGLVLLLRERRTRADAATAIGICSLTLAGIAVMNNWRGGWTIGPRYLALVYPFLAWGAVAGLEPLVRRSPRVAAAVAVGTTAVGLALSGLPSAYYPHYPIPVDRPVSQIVRVLIEHDYAPHALSNLAGVHGTASMIPMLAIGVLAVAWLAWALPSGGERASAVGLGLVVAAALCWPLLIDPRPDHPEIRESIELITTTWDPRGHDRVAVLAAELRDAPSSRGYFELADLLEEEGRAREAGGARVRGAQLDRASAGERGGR